MCEEREIDNILKGFLKIIILALLVLFVIFLFKNWSLNRHTITSEPETISEFIIQDKDDELSRVLQYRIKCVSTTEWYCEEYEVYRVTKE